MCSFISINKTRICFGEEWALGRRREEEGEESFTITKNSDLYSLKLVIFFFCKIRCSHEDAILQTLLTLSRLG